MKDGAIGLVVGDPREKGIMGDLGRMIMSTTHSDKTHCIRFNRGHFFDDTITLGWKWGFWPHLRSGVRVRKTIDEKNVEWRDRTKPYTAEQSYAAGRFCLWYAQRDYHYNVWQLAAFYLIYPTRSLWVKLGWIPFKRSIDLVCSTFAAMVDDFVGDSVLPGVDPTLIVPGDFDKSPLYGPEAK